MTKLQIDPKVQMAVMFIVGMITFLGTNSLPTSVPANVATNIHDWSIWIGQLYTVAIGPLLLAYTNSNPGPLAPADPPAVVKAHAEADAVAKAEEKSSK